MPKASPQTYPLSALMAINKPTGIVSMTLLNQLQPLFGSSTLFKDPSKDTEDKNQQGGKGNKKRKWKENRVKMGQGGTLDPLADGVLVLGTNAATKHLSRFLDCTKEYRAIGLMGCATDSYDSQGKIVKTTSFEGVTREKIEGVLDRFRGEIEQVPPIFSALKMDGKPLYEYARTKTPLPRPIASRKCTVHDLVLVDFKEGSEHTYEYPKEELGKTEKEELERIEKMVKDGAVVVPEATAVEVKEGEVASAVAEVKVADPAPTSRPPYFEISMTVSSGTYVRSIVHDIGLALGSTAHVVKLTRTRQGEFPLDPDNVKADTETFSGGCIEWSLLEKAIKDLEAAKKEGRTLEKGEDGMLEWEREILNKCKEV